MTRVDDEDDWAGRILRNVERNRDVGCDQEMTRRASSETTWSPIDLGWGNVRIHAEQVRRVVHALDLSKTRVVLAKGCPNDLGTIVSGQVVDVGLAEQVRLESGPERSHPRDMPVRCCSVGPLTDRIEIPLRSAGGKGRFGGHRTRCGTVHVKKDQRTKWRREACRTIHQCIDQSV